MQKLGDLPSGVMTTYVPAVSVSGNFAVVVGHSWPTGAPFMWEARHGIRNLRDVLVNGYDLNLNDWMLTRVNGISQDGLTIVGTGTRAASGATEGWIARLGSSAAVQPTMQIDRSGDQMMLSWPVSAVHGSFK